MKIDNNKKTIIFINNAFLKKFNFSNEASTIGKDINFLFSKKDKDLVPFSSLKIYEVINGNQIYSYFPKGKEETFFYISSFFFLCAISSSIN